MLSALSVQTTPPQPRAATRRPELLALAGNCECARAANENDAEQAPGHLQNGLTIYRKSEASFGESDPEGLKLQNQLGVTRGQMEREETRKVFPRRATV